MTEKETFQSRASSRWRFSCVGNGNWRVDAPCLFRESWMRLCKGGVNPPVAVTNIRFSKIFQRKKPTAHLALEMGARNEQRNFCPWVGAWGAKYYTGIVLHDEQISETDTPTQQRSVVSLVGARKHQVYSRSVMHTTLNLFRTNNLCL